ncbi:MAG: double-strand break repair protein AddB [Cucumibacter sp.]
MRQNLFTIAPHAPFLPALADALLRGTLVPHWPRQGPFWLADVTIFLPTRRARLALIDHLVERLGGAALLPAIKTLGEEDADQSAFFDPDFPGPAATHPAARQLVLAKLVEAWVKAEDPEGETGFASAVDHLALGASLGRLIDDFAIEEVAPETLQSIVPATLAENWQRTLKFLEIVLEAWPAHLEANGQADHARLRRERIDRETENLAALYGERPVIAAGSTGSIKSTARLIAAIARLKRGAVVLPGLDTGLDATTLAALRAGDEHRHAHPQYGLARLLDLLKATPASVVELARKPSARTLAVDQALALAEATGDWAARRAAIGEKALKSAAAHLSLVLAPTQHEEARAVAVAAHRALLDAKTVGIVSPDRGLARRIAHELQRFGIQIEDGAGTPLAQCRAARLVRQALLIVTRDYAPVDFAALLAGRYVTLGLERGEIARRLELLELAALRGQRPRDGIVGIRACLAENLAGNADHPLHKLTPSEGVDLADLLGRLEAALAPLARAFASGAARPTDLAPAIAESLAALRRPAEGEAPALEGEAELAQWLLAISSAPFAPSLSRDRAADGLVALMQSEGVAPVRPSRPDIAIWGRIEARLQSADLMIAAGLNEASWPGPADPGPWLSRTMRLAAGLEPPERRTGLAAHDFVMALGAQEVLLTCSIRIGTSPADPSRFLQRLTGFLGEAATRKMQARGKIWLDHATALDHVETPVPVARPAPRPPANLRPRRLSVTEIETLIRDPYAIYAKHVLRLRPLDPLGESPDAAVRGSLIHDILGRFIAGGGDPLSPNALTTLTAMAEASFAGLGDIENRARLWRRRFLAMADAFLNWERARHGIVRRHAEIDGAVTLAVEGEPFTLYGRADRIDVTSGGTLEIVDFKTGAVPDRRQMQDRLAPQLPIEALIARHGGFKEVGPAEASALAWVKLSHGPKALEVKQFKIDDLPLAEAIDDHWRRVQHHIALFLLSNAHPMHPRLLPDSKARYEPPYDHLARLGEWGATGEGEE